MTAITELDTPAVTVHLDVMEDNIRRVQAHLDAGTASATGPHIKTHKIPAIGQMQMAAGAVGITCQKLGEVEVFADAGVADDVLLTYNILGAAKTERLMAARRGACARLTVVVRQRGGGARALRGGGRDHGRTSTSSSSATPASGRTGVQTPDEALRPGADGHGAAAPAVPRPHDVSQQAIPTPACSSSAALALFKGAGIPVPMVSGGGTPALATVDRFPMLTEHRAGTCVYNDAMVVSTRHRDAGTQCAMRVRATVVSRPTADRARARRGVEGAHLRPVLHEGLRPRHGVPGGAASRISPRSTRWWISRACPERPKVGDVVERGAQPLLRGHQHGGRGLRRARRRRRGGVAGRRARPRALRPAMPRTGAQPGWWRRSAARRRPPSLLALRQPDPLASTTPPSAAAAADRAHAPRGRRPCTWRTRGAGSPRSRAWPW